MSNNSNSSGSSISFPAVLFLIFLVLKLTENIDWNWWWVTSPLWIPFAAIIAIIGFFVIGAGIILAVAAVCIGVTKLFSRR